MISPLSSISIPNTKSGGSRSRGRARRRRSRRSRNTVTRGSRGQANGDVPKRAKSTYVTLSTRIPRETEIFTCRQELGVTTLAASNAAIVSTAFNFQLSQVSLDSNLKALFDQYRVDAVRIRIAPQNNAIGLVTNSTTTLVDLYSVIDYDDATNNVTTDALARKYSNCCVLAPGESVERTFQPRAAVAAYQGAFTGYGNVGGMWFDTAYDAVQHYGMKIFIPQATVAQTLLQTWDVFFELFISFRNIE